MSLWSNFSVGVSGLQTGSNALNTVAHNLSNVDTTGFTRQQVLQADKSYITLSKTASAVSFQQTGLGTYYSTVRQVRDVFLDQTYRRELGRENFYEISSSTIDEVQDLFGELNSSPFQTSMSDLWTAVQELSKDPCNSVTQGALVSEADEFLARAQAVYDGLSSYQDNLNVQIKQQVDKINDYGVRLRELNDEIRNIELAGEKANDLRDERNQILDELSKLADITYDEDIYGNVSVQIEGEDFVRGTLPFKIELATDSTTGFYTPYWPQNTTSYTDPITGKEVINYDAAKVFPTNQKISSDLNTDIGGLKAMIIARGDHRATYADVENDYDSVSESILMNVQAEFDQLIHNVMSAINEVMADAAGVTEISADTTDTDLAAVYDYLKTQDEANGIDTTDKTYRVLEVGSNNEYMTDNDGSPLELFQRTGVDSYTTVNVNGTDYWVYNEEDLSDAGTLLSASNSHINDNLKQTPTLMGFRLADGSEDTETMEKMKAVFTESKYTLNPYVLKTVTLNDYYGDLISQAANSGYVYNSIYENQQDTVESTLSARDQVTAVSSDEELSNMIRFQNAYNASSRFINVVDEMLEHLLTSLA